VDLSVFDLKLRMATLSSMLRVAFPQESARVIKNDCRDTTINSNLR